MEHHFIGIKAGVQVKKEAVELQTGLDLKRYYKALPSEEDFHLTLLFLGGWEWGKKVQLWERLQHYRLPKFSLTFSSYAYFGNPDKPRVLFLQPEDNELLQQLYDIILEEALQLGYPAPKNGFRPHITIAKKFGNTNNFPYASYGTIEKIDQSVHEVNLFQVKPQDHPRYQTIRTLELTETFPGTKE
ncbi:RNA 2',3'-cyclic phosphodiesterase [Alkalicoccus daliensis]|uniref:RNA 2',3'-cyclic phosphodiesterase n=1 Tax=Alkalicoccus daliensis TaxID=745820 RepID=A0A1H0H2E1_9BACI|nr:RNA 2',3'-cyclic phosphodiesterase [Alkalicoccus daliensis]SDO13275.1 2'-5' RNA ligase [Alkalicoccus daliensis]